MRALILAAVIVVVSPAPALARSAFQPYEGKDAVQEGRGGAKTIVDGVEFWTMGDPPRRYQIVGLITDTRGTGLFSGKAVGPGTAKKIREVGADAGIVLDESESIRSYLMTGDMAMAARRKTAVIVAVKYLDDEPKRAD